MTRWEYKATKATAHADLLSKLNQLGSDGWELVFISVNQIGMQLELHAYLKRPKQPD